MEAAQPKFNVRDYGATGDGKTLDTVAIQKAIDACTTAGGGEVIFEKGTYLTGSLELKSHVCLLLGSEAVLLGSRDRKDYPLGKLIYASDATNISITGGGTIDGQGDAFWEKKEETYRGPDYRGTAAFNYRALPRPSFLYFRRCRNMTVNNVTLKNSPSWTIHLLRCEQAFISQVTIRNPLHGPNTDGIDINSSIDVEVSSCDIITGDDGVVLKSTEPGHDHPSRNIRVSRCRIWSACNCLKLGTETHDRFENITFRECHLYSESENPLERPLAGIAIESVDGAHVSNVQISDITMDNVRAPIFVRLGHRGGNSPKTQQVEPRVPGQIEKVSFRNITAKRSMFTSSITGIPGHSVSSIALHDVNLEYEGGGKEEWAMADVPDEQVIKRYPEAQMFGRLPAYGLYCRHVEGIWLDHLKVTCLAPDPRPLLVCDDVKGLRVFGLDAPRAESKLPIMWLINTREVLVWRCTAPANTNVYIGAEGDQKMLDTIVLKDNNITPWKTPLKRFGPGELINMSLPLFPEKSPGMVVIDATKMRLLDPMAAHDDEPSHPYITVPPPGSRDHGSALCRFEITKAGEYEIWVQAFASSGETNSFYASIDRGPLALTEVNPTNNWYWLTIHNREAEDKAHKKRMTYSLQPGTHTLQLRNRESGTRIQTIILARTDLKFDPEE